jgi:class 3 adenylate cyclase/TolB-like protein/Flp pilus assembly protein TadD
MAERVERRLAAILALDVVGYSRLMERDETGTLGRLKAHRKELMEPLVKSHGGRIVKLMGDGALVEFPSAVEAVASAVEIQERIADREDGLPEAERIALRIGINVGDIILEGDDIYGDGVNIAARLEGLAEPGGICAARNVVNQVRNKLDLDFEPMGEQRVKNIAEPVVAFRVRAGGGRPAVASKPAWWPVRRWFLAGAAVLALLVVTGVAWLRPLQTAKPPANPPPPAAVVTGPALDKHRLAVLPFTNISADKNDMYFADGITEEMITRLSQIPELSVIARTSIMGYKGTRKGIAEIGHELSAGTILEGSVRRAGDEVRITAQLIDSRSQAHLWAESYDRPIHEIFAVQSDVAQQVARALQIALLADVRERIELPATTDPVAHELYLKARRDHYEFSTHSLERAIAGYRAAAARDPGYVMAYAGLAQALTDALGALPGSQREQLAAATAAAERALSMDANLAEAHAALGYAKFFAWDWAGAEASFKRALELNPKLAPALDGYNWGYLTQIRGQYDTALAGEQRAAELDPLNIVIVADVAFVLYHAGRYNAAIEAFQRAAEMAPNYMWSYLGLGAANIALRRYAEAIRWHEKAVEVSGGDSMAKARLGWSLGRAGRTNEARAILGELTSRYQQEKFTPTNFVLVYEGLGDTDNAFLWLERAYDDQDFLLAFLQGREFEDLWGDPRYAAMKAKIGFPPRS